LERKALRALICAGDSMPARRNAFGSPGVLSAAWVGRGASVQATNDNSKRRRIMASTSKVD
jgi:hypothetical protein